MWYAGSVTRWLLSLTLAVAAACGGSGASDQAVVAGPEAMSTPYLTIQETLARDSIDGLSQLSARVVTAAEPVQAALGVPEIIAGGGGTADGGGSLVNTLLAMVIKERMDTEKPKSETSSSESKKK